jgi:hypothetical protein
VRQYEHSLQLSGIYGKDLLPAVIAGKRFGQYLLPAAIICDGRYIPNYDKGQEGY